LRAHTGDRPVRHHSSWSCQRGPHWSFGARNLFRSGMRCNSDFVLIVYCILDETFARGKARRDRAPRLCCRAKPIVRRENFASAALRHPSAAVACCSIDQPPRQEPAAVCPCRFARSGERNACGTGCAFNRPFAAKSWRSSEPRHLRGWKAVLVLISRHHIYVQIV
jgi:hypothetical protein